MDDSYIDHLEFDTTSDYFYAPIIHVSGCYYFIIYSHAADSNHVYGWSCVVDIKTDNGWMQWNNASNPDTTYSWSWNFDFPNGTGYYEFYSMGKKAGSTDETPPGSADAICRYYINTSFNLNRTTWNIGTINLGANATTTNINLTNTGNVAISLQIKADNATNSSKGLTWNLTSTPGYKNFSLQYNKTIGGGSWTNVNTSYAAFYNNLAIGGYVTFDLKIFMATTSDKVYPMSFDITFKSVAS
jgi:hypothetical protein